MNIGLAFKMAIKSIYNNRLRSFLTMLGVIIGVAAVIVAVGFAQSCMASVSSMIEGMGTNVITAMIVDRSSRNDIKISDLDAFAERSAYIDDISPYVTGTAIARANGENKTTTIIGANETYLEMQDVAIEQGRNISVADVENSNKVAVIGKPVVDKLFPTQNPIGKKIKINGSSFTVVGIMETLMGGMEGTTDDRIILPVNVAQRVLKINGISIFMANASSADEIDLATEAIDDYLYSVFKDEDSYIVFTQESILSILDDISAIMMLILGSIATISLVVGGIRNYEYNVCFSD